MVSPSNRACYAGVESICRKATQYLGGVADQKPSCANALTAQPWFRRLGSVIMVELPATLPRKSGQIIVVLHNPAAHSRTGRPSVED